MKVVITGVGPISSLGIGKEDFWNGVLNKDLNIESDNVYLDGELWGSYLLHKVRKFDIKDFNINKVALNEIKQWKEYEEVHDLYYLLAAAKLALDDSKLKVDDKSKLPTAKVHTSVGFWRST